jgi:hypothetical protein
MFRVTFKPSLDDSPNAKGFIDEKDIRGVGLQGHEPRIDIKALQEVRCVFLHRIRNILFSMLLFVMLAHEDYAEKDSKSLTF